MLEDLRNAPEGSFIELQMCGHNPTGFDPNMEEWMQIAEICKERKLRPIFDATFQGFVSGDWNEDAASLRYFHNQGINLIVIQSFDATMSLYGERLGALHIVCDNEVIKKKV